MAWAQYLSGRRVTAVEMTIAATVMVILTVFTRCRLAALRRTARFPGTQRLARRLSRRPTVVDQRERDRL